MSTVPQALLEEGIEYPESDGLPMAENTLQFQWIVTVKEGLNVWLSGEREAFVAGDLFWYPVKGQNRIRVAPDALVAFGRPKGHRRSYKQWQEDNVAPQVVFEVLSPGNTVNEMKEKLAFYDRYGVQEYYVYDPETNELEGWRRPSSNHGLARIPSMSNWVSPLLQIRFALGADELQIFTAEGDVFLTFEELAAQARAAREQVQAERRKADSERHRADSERHRADSERQRADSERQRAADAETRAEEERRRLQLVVERAKALGIDVNDILKE